MTSSSSYSAHIKHSALKNLVTQDIPCLDKLAQINELLGLPPPVATESEENENEKTENEDGINEDPVVLAEELKQKSIEKITEAFTGKKLKLAKQFITEIEKNNSISWDQNSFELILDGAPVLHSNIRLLIEKLITESAAVLPLGLVQFVYKLLQIRLPLNYYKGIDCINIREALLKIKKESGKSGEAPLPFEESIVQEGLESNQEVQSGRRSSQEEEDREEEGQTKKRQRLEQGEEEREELKKRKRSGDSESSDFSTAPEGLRRSKRIKSTLNWKSNENV